MLVQELLDYNSGNNTFRMVAGATHVPNQSASAHTRGQNDGGSEDNFKGGGERIEP